MRQKDDKEFAKLLNRLREGKHSKDDIALLKQRFLNVRPEEDNYLFNITHYLLQMHQCMLTTMSCILFIKMIRLKSRLFTL